MRVWERLCPGRVCDLHILSLRMWGTGSGIGVAASSSQIASTWYLGTRTPPQLKRMRMKDERGARSGSSCYCYFYGFIDYWYWRIYCIVYVYVYVYT